MEVEVITFKIVETMSKKGYSRGWCFTLNNYCLIEEKFIEDINCRYITFGHEVGSECHTPHLQGYILFKDAKSFETVKGLFPDRTHIEAAKTVAQAIDYAQKDGVDIYERGDRPKTNKEKGNAEEQKERYKQAVKLAKEGNIEAIEEVDPVLHLRFYRTFKELRKDYMPKLESIDTEFVGYWIYGPPGTGKTSMAHALYPDAYPKALNEWWDGYQGESTVIIDDLDKYHVSLGSSLKQWLHQWEFIAPVKGGSIKIRPKLVVITSNYTPEEIWEDPITAQAIRRRCRFFHKLALVDPAPGGSQSTFT